MTRGNHPVYKKLQYVKRGNHPVKGCDKGAMPLFTIKLKRKMEDVTREQPSSLFTIKLYIKMEDVKQGATTTVYNQTLKKNGKSNKLHMVARKRMPYHIMKCRKNFGQRDYATCPFNARHVVPKVEFQDHISRCEDRGRVKGNTNTFTVAESTECWDDEADYINFYIYRKGRCDKGATTLFTIKLYIN